MSGAVRLYTARTRSRSARARIRRHDANVRELTEARWKTERAFGDEVRIRVVRCTLGEEYNHARMGECLVTLRGARPVLVRTAEAIRELGRRWKSAEEFHSACASLARVWGRKRKPVTHPKWRAR